MADKWIPVFPGESAPVRVPGRPAAEASLDAPQGRRGGGARHSEAQNALYRVWMRDQVPLVLQCRDGVTLLGRLWAFDTYALHLRSDSGDDILVYKHGVIAIRVAQGGEEESPGDGA